MSLPIRWDGRRGIRKWFPLGNIYLGDCVVAAIFHLVMMHNLATASSWKKLLYRVGFKVPTNGFAIEDYTEFLATLDEKPSGTMGVDPLQYLPWLVSKGIIKWWANYAISEGPSDTKMDTIHGAMVEYNGAMLLVELTERAYQAGTSPIPWTIEAGEVPDPNLAHAIADVSYGPSFDGIVTWGIMKSASSAFIQECAYGLFVIA